MPNLYLILHLGLVLQVLKKIMEVKCEEDIENAKLIEDVKIKIILLFILFI
jgi:hypothetical protein